MRNVLSLAPLVCLAACVAGTEALEPNKGQARVDDANGSSVDDTNGSIDDHPPILQSDAWVMDNIAYVPGSYAINERLRIEILGGETLLGLYFVRDSASENSLLRLYSLRDHDDPFFPANNFRTAANHNQCCRFLIAPESLSSDRSTARAEIGLRWSGGSFSSTNPIGVPFGTLLAPGGAPPVPELGPLNDVTIDGELMEHGGIEGNIHGNISARTLDSLRLEILNDAGMHIDFDRDGDGLETVVDNDGNGTIDTCLDGCRGDCREPRRIPPTLDGYPETCLAGVDDGISFHLHFHATAAAFLGIAP